MMEFCSYTIKKFHLMFTFTMKCEHMAKSLAIDAHTCVSSCIQNIIQHCCVIQIKPVRYLS
jgi:hypothetical protein